MPSRTSAVPEAGSAPEAQTVARGDDAERYAELARLELAPLWEFKSNLFPAEPPLRAVPFIWRYAEVRPHILHFGAALPLEKAERRVLMLINPGLRETAATVANIYAGIQLILPGETAPAHRHTANAFRFIIEGHGASTTVDGEKTTMRPGDLLLTPGWSWHDHDHEGEGPMAWLDGLDYPLINALGVQFFEMYGERKQKLLRPTDAASRCYAHARLNPVRPGRPSPKPRAASPVTNYPWERTAAALEAIGFDVEGADQYGVVLEYVDPLSDGPVLPTMSCQIMRFRPGFIGTARRRTASEIVHVVRGSGCSIINGQRFDWTARDTIALPAWSTCRHYNRSQSEDAVLFSYSDRPVLDALGLYREDSGHPDVAAVKP